MTDAAPDKRATAAGIGLHSSLKRIAWAYGCAKKGSDNERRLLELLTEKMKQGEEGR